MKDAYCTSTGASTSTHESAVHDDCLKLVCFVDAVGLQVVALPVRNFFINKMPAVHVSTVTDVISFFKIEYTQMTMQAS